MKFQLDNKPQPWNSSELIKRLNIPAKSTPIELASYSGTKRNRRAVSRQRKCRRSIWEPIIEDCPFFFDALKNGGHDHWRTVWNVPNLPARSSRTATSWRTSWAMSTVGYYRRQHEGDGIGEIAGEEQQGLGWPSCTAIQSEGCKLCATCKHFGKIKSPLNLALPTAPPRPKSVVGQAKEKRDRSSFRH